MESEMKDSLRIPDHWTFESQNVAQNFDAHVREQLPWYELVTQAVSIVARQYIPEKGLVYDIGASTGNIGRSLAETIEKKSVEFIAIESSKEMAMKWDGPGKLVITDARKYDFSTYDCAICFLVLMFLPVHEREWFIRELVSKIRKGGALLIVDKTKPTSGYPSVALSRLTIAGKVAAGAPADEIIEKELSLAGYQRPIDEKELPEYAVEFFRFGEFAGWIIEG